MPEELLHDEVAFYDPILELLIPKLYVHKERIDAAPTSLEENLAQLSYDLIYNTVELGRLRFLRQAGFGWLEFPSATHTRFAHSLGSLTCGITALDHIRVIRPNGQRVKLRETLGEHETDFLLALLLHDIGHLPFSHVLENNPGISNTGINHEILTVDLIMGENENYEPKTKVYELMKRKAKEVGIKTVSQVLHEAKKTYEKDISPRDIIYPDFICALISKRVGGKTSEDILKGYFYLKGLIIGIIDLDRLDHYARDSFFMGVKLGTFNILGFLRSITLDQRDAVGHYENVHTLISKEGVPHVLQILFSKELLWSKALDAPKIRAYECMLSKAFSLGQKKLIKTTLSESEMLIYRDDDLLNTLLQEDKNLGEVDKMIHSLVNQIIYGHPYELLIVVEERKPEHTLEILEEIRREMIKKYKLKDIDLLFYVPKIEEGEKIRDIQWSNLWVEGTGGKERVDSKADDRNRLCEYLEDRGKSRRYMVRFFVNYSVKKEAKENLAKDIMIKFRR